MTVTHHDTPPGPAPRRSGWLLRLAASRPFQRWAARFPLTRGHVRREGEAMFDLVAGFCHTQTLRAFVGLDLPAALEHPQTIDALSLRLGVAPERLRVLLRSAEALDLVRERSGRWRLSLRGTALANVPGLSQMIAHHDILYRDLSDAVAFFRGETEPELARFWPYVFGAGAAEDPSSAQRYSQLMSDSQSLVADDTLSLIRLSNARHLMDVGGGTGAFLRAVRGAYPDLPLTVFDLPAVLAGADLAPHRIAPAPGSFRDDALPTGADTISLIRVLYDHSDDTVLSLLRNVRAALPPQGRLIISEPMGGNRAGDAYFALYCMAMETGRVRQPREIAQLLRETGFAPSKPRTTRPFVTTVIESVKQD